MEQILRALHAFIRISIDEEHGVEYIDRLAKCAVICEDYETFILVTEFFNNDAMLHCMLSFLEKIN